MTKKELIEKLKYSNTKTIERVAKLDKLKDIYYWLGYAAALNAIRKDLESEENKEVEL